MPKTQEELDQLKQEVQQLNEKLKELTENELKIVTGGLLGGVSDPNPYNGGIVKERVY